MSDDSIPENPPSPESATPVASAGPWMLAAREFFRRRNAVTGLALVVFFWVLALCAPFLAHRLPLLWIENGEWSFPLFREFLSPYDLRHEGGLERALGFALLYLPLAVGGWWLSGRCWPALRKPRRSVALVLGGLLSAALLLSMGRLVWGAGGEDPFYAEGFAAVDAEDVLRPAALAAWIADGAGGLEKIVAAFPPEQRAAFPDWHAQQPDAPDPHDADALQRTRARLLAEGLNRALLNDQPLSETDPPGARARRLRALLDHQPPPSKAEARTATERLNRLTLEARAPADGLKSFRSFRSGYLLAATMGMLAALGVAAIFMIGANEMRIERRCLVLLALAALVAPLFLFERVADSSGQTRIAWRQPRNQPRDFRADAEAGKGWGLFPPLPYGPNEQGFGPKLPPFWRTPSARPTVADVLDWEAATRLLSAPLDPQDPAARARHHLLTRDPEPLDALLQSALRQWTTVPAVIPRPADPTTPAPAEEFDAFDPDNRAGLIATALGSPEGRALFVAWLGSVIKRADAYDAEAFAGLRVIDDFNIRPYLVDVSRGDARAWTDLPGMFRERRNRLLVEKAFPGVLRQIRTSQWKRPDHKAGTHWFGTDESGRDVLVRMLHGARVSLSVGFVSVALATLIGLVIGAMAAYYGGWVDWLISRAIELMMCFPSFFLILAMIAVLDKRSILNIMLVIGFTGWTGVARLVRGEILQQRTLDYVVAARALGAGDARIIFRHILPNAMTPVFVTIIFGITGAILTESGLSFLGLGVTPPTPTWGQLLAEAREAPLNNWWLVVFPGAALFLGVLSYNLVGEGVRDALDPRLRGGHR